MDKTSKINEILKNAIRQADALTATQAKKLIELLVGITAKNKEDIKKDYDSFADTVSQETYRQLQEAISILTEKANDNQLEVRQLTNKQKKLFEDKIAYLENLAEEVKNYVPLDGEPGKDADEEKIIEEVLAKIPKVEQFELLGEEIVDSINSLEVTPDKQIDAKHIKNLPEVRQFIGGGSIGIKGIVAGTNVTVDDSNPQYPVVSSTGGGGGGTWGSITGTLSDQTDLQSALDAKSPHEANIYDYVVYRSGANTVAVKTSDGSTVSTNSDAAVVLQAVIDLCDATTGTGGAIFVKPGTYSLASTITIQGDQTFDSKTVMLHGSGIQTTIFAPATNTNGITISNRAKVSLKDFAIIVEGSSSGIVSTNSSVGQRAFWQSEFKNIYIYSNVGAHTGWGMDLGNPFRSVFENIDINQVKNGMRLQALDTSTGYNPGDSTFTRMFIELGSYNGGTGIQITSPSTGDMNQMNFNMIELYAGGTNQTAILFDGASGEVNHTRWTGINVEQFKTILDIQKGRTNYFEFNYIITGNVTGTTYFKTSSTAYGNHVKSATYLDTPTRSVVIVNDANTIADQPNVFEGIVMQGTATTTTFTTTSATILRDITDNINGTSAYLDTSKTTLQDPGADRIQFWDDSTGKFGFLTAGTGLNISGTTMTATGSAGGSNTQVQFNDSGSLGGDDGLVYSKTNDTLTITSDTSGNGLVVQSAKAAGAGTENLVVIQTTDSLWDRPLLRINDNTSSGGAANIRIDSLNPDIEFVETDQVSPAGKFEVAVNSDKFQINGRSAADSGFEPIATFSRYGSGGMVGIGTLYDTPNAMLEVVSTGTPAYNLSISSAVGATSGNIFNVDGSGNVIINDRGSAVVLRVEGDNDANLLYTDGTNDRVGIGLNNPTQKLHVKGRVQFGVASNTSGTIDLANSGAAGLTRIAPASPSADVTVTLPGVASTLAILGANTFTGTQTLPAGTASAGTAPLYFTSGTNLTSAEAGAQEYDGKVFYSTTVAGARGVSPSTMYAIIDSDFTLTAGTGVQSAFPAGYDVWTLEGSTTYEFEGKYFMTLGTTSRTTALAFALSGGASITSISYEAMSWAGQGNATLTAQSSVWVDRVASTVVQAATNNTGTFIKFHGIIRMNAGGTVTPQINFSANPTGTNLMKANSYIKFTPIGSNTMTGVGNVA